MPVTARLHLAPPARPDHHAGTVVDLRTRSRRQGPAGPEALLDPSGAALVRAARHHAADAEVLQQAARREADGRGAAVLALHVLYGCSVETIADLLGTNVAQARTWVREGRRAERAAG